MKTVNTETVAAAVTDIAVRAGHAILDVYERDFEVTKKQDESPLTQADLASHVIIRNALASLTPQVPLLSEESADIDFTTRAAWREYWLVDPMDGTKEFVNRNGEFTVNIALIRNHRPVLGVVHVPVSGVTYTGIEGLGATRRQNGSAPENIRVRIPCPDPVVVVGSRSHANPELLGYLRKIGNFEFVSMGSSLKFCLLAEGKADFYPRLGPTSEWDTAAAHAVVTAAGGQILMLDGQALEYNRKESLLNPEFLVIADPDRDWLSLFANYRP
ncbi:MAG: 3'(2'),5'-bisphosphate nucleotidase CysQ [Xanthomonadales bacterium]|nr:3'(2'),5'-bisphosphate nucleotidase CysQ [Xanthomonadales bacterium]